MPLSDAHRTNHTRCAIATKTTSPSVLEANSARIRTLASQCPVSAPLVDTPWMMSWVEAFTPSEAFLLCAYERDDLVGLAALQRMTETCLGRRLRVVQSLTNVESYRFDFLALEGRLDVATDLWRALCCTGSEDLIRLDHVPANSPTPKAALEVAREQGWRVALEETFQTPWRAISSGEPWDCGLKSKFKANLRHRERRLAARGRVAFEVESAVEQTALQSFYQLEASGWKGARGTAVAQQPNVKRLYDGMVARARDDVLIPILTVSGKPVAAQVIRVSGRVMFLLKTAYDEAYADCAPGHLLTARVLQYGVEHGMDALDFLADNAPWKSDWATGFLPHTRVLLFAPTFAGRCAYWARHGIRKQVKRAVGGLYDRWLRRPP